MGDRKKCQRRRRTRGVGGADCESIVWLKDRSKGMVGVGGREREEKNSLQRSPSLSLLKLICCRGVEGGEPSVGGPGPGKLTVSHSGKPSK